MSINFNTIPQTVRTPGQFTEFDNSRAVQGASAQPNRLLILGTMLAAGTAAPNTPKAVNSPGQAEVLFGRGSQLAEMLKAVKAVNNNTECYAIGLVAPSGGTAAAATLTPTGPATAAGEISLYVAGKRVPVSVAIGDTALIVGAALAAAINADTTLPLTAVADGATGVVTVTIRWKGLTGVGVDLRTSYYDGEQLPAGITLVIAFTTAGTGTPDVASALAAMGDTQYNTIVTPFYDPTSLTAVKAELETRWGPMVQKEGVAFTAAPGTHSTLATLGSSRNSKHVCLMGTGTSPTAPWIWAAVVGAVDAAEPDPARPRQTLPLPGLLPPAPASRFTRSERDSLLGDGVSTFLVAAGGMVVIERLITTYQTNAGGFVDISYLDVTTLRTLSYLRYSQRALFALKYPRHKLAADGTNFAPGQAVLTPSVARGELFGLFHEWESMGLVQNFSQFKGELDVVLNDTDPNRLDVQMGPNLIASFMVLATQIQFIL